MICYTYSELHNQRECMQVDSYVSFSNRQLTWVSISHACFVPSTCSFLITYRMQSPQLQHNNMSMIQNSTQYHVEKRTELSTALEHAWRLVTDINHIIQRSTEWWFRSKKNCENVTNEKLWCNEKALE